MPKTQQLSEKITRMLLYEIQSGEYAGRDTLPPEVELAEHFGVSRHILRECLTSLEREGWVTRKHGIGTLVNRDVVHVRTRLDLNYELSNTLEMNGKHAETCQLRSVKVPASAELALQMKIPEGEELLRVSRMIKANGKPGVFCIDYVPTRLIRNPNYHQSDFKPSIFAFLEKFCNTSVETNLAEVRSMPATEEISAALEIPLGYGLLYLGEVGYDLHANPVLYSEEYFIDRVIRHMIVRKKI